MSRGVHWLCERPGSGYGDAGEAYIGALRGAGVPVTWTPLGWSHNDQEGGGFRPLEPAVELDGAAHADIAHLPLDADRIVVQAAPVWWAALATVARERRLVAYSTWESDRVPPHLVNVLNRYERVLVPSRFNSATFAASGVHVPLRVVPHVARPIAPRPNCPRENGRFVFYLIATWSVRKAIPDAVAAFVEAFSAEDDVELVVHTTREDYVALGRYSSEAESVARPECSTWFTLARLLAGRRDLPAITLSTRRLAREELDALHRRGDCFLLLSHGEGWGLGAFDAAACGNPAIVTGWGGMLDYLPEGYPYRVDYDLVPTRLAGADMWWLPRTDARWANARIEHAAELLRHVYEHRPEAAAWGRALRSHVRRSFSADRVAQQLLEAISD